jgi:hypothetical protein
MTTAESWSMDVSLSLLNAYVAAVVDGKVQFYGHKPLSDSND